MPDAGTVFDAAYRVGNGTAGNVGAETIRCLVFRQTTGNAGEIQPRNPLPAAGGTDPEPIEEVKLFAPSAFCHVLDRAITADDYAALAADNQRRFAERTALIAAALREHLPTPVKPKQRASVEEEAGEEPTVGRDILAAPFQPLQGAKARIRWTGSWNQVFVAVDPMATETAGTELLKEIGSYLEPYRRIGHDISVRPAEYVGLDLGLFVCVDPEYLRGHVESALLDVFSNRVLPDGSRGFFHPDNLTFGDGIYVSRIIAAAQAVTGVRNVTVTRLERFEIGEPPPGTESVADELPPHGVLALGNFEIARLDNDPDCPEKGRLTLVLGGGR
jgi:predicted phage baseplate assembly protein